MAHTSGHHETLPRRKINDAIFEIDQKMSIQNEKEFINVIVFMPMIFALHHRILMTESFTLQSVWLYHLSLQASASL